MGTATPYETLSSPAYYTNVVFCNMGMTGMADLDNRAARRRPGGLARTRIQRSA